MSHQKEILNTEEVEFLLDQGAGPGQEHAPTDNAQQVVTMRGDLEQIHLADIFQTLGTAKMEGVLAVSNPVEQRQVYFKDGLVRILVTQRATSRRLGQRLVAAGLLDTDNLRKALVEQRKKQLPLGKVLVDSGYVTAEQIDDILAQQTSEELFNLFTWLHGSFEFYRGPCTDEATLQRLDLCPRFEVNSLLLEVARRADEWEDILAAIGSLDELPIRTEADPAVIEALGEKHRAVLQAADGNTSFRDLADQVMLSPFECSRAARDLVKQGLLQCATAEQLLAAARNHLDHGHTKNALMIAHTLRDRSDEQPLPIVRELAALLRACNEGALACGVVLAAAQLQADPGLALELAREARTHNPRDLEALTFLRKTMLAHLAPESAEIEATTIALLDGLLADGKAEEVLQLADEIEQLGSLTPAVLVRQARALAKQKQVPAAIEALVQAATAYGTAGDRAHEIEAYDLALRLDRDRKDIRKTLKQLRMTPRKRLLRIGVFTATGLLLAAMGFVWISVMVHSQRAAKVADELQQLLAKSDVDGARAALPGWRELLGECAETEDLKQQVEFAIAAQKMQHHAAAKRHAAAQFKQAADQLLEGEVLAACTIYQTLLEDPAVQEDAREAVGSRFDTLTRDLEDAARRLASAIPPMPGELMDRHQLEETRSFLRQQVRPQLLRAADVVLAARDHLPPAISAERRTPLLKAAEKAQPLLAQAVEVQAAYERATSMSDEQRRLDPLFKGAIEHERTYAFRDALADYRQLLAAGAGTKELLSHFRDKIAELEGLVNALDAVDAATKSGDFTAARLHLAAAQRLQPKVPFATFVRLPITVRTSMPGAEVTWNGAPAGATPCATTYVPTGRNDLVVRLPGFQVERPALPAEPVPTLDVLLTLQRDAQGEFPTTVDQPITFAGNGTVIGIDRGGVVFALQPRGKGGWRQETGDTAGYLSPPLLHGDRVLVASLDGPVRALDRETGKPRWRTDNLATEFAPALLGDRLAVATAAGNLVLLEVSDGHEFTRTQLPSPVIADLQAVGSRLALALQNGAVEVRDDHTLELVWHATGAEGGSNFAITSTGLALLRDDGHASLRDLGNGNVIWQRDLAGSPVGRLTTDGQSLLATLDDRVLLLDLRDGHELWSAPRPESGWLDSARYAGSRIAVPTRDGSVLVYGRDAATPRYRLDGDRKIARLEFDAKEGALLLAGRRFSSFPRLP